VIFFKSGMNGSLAWLARLTLHKPDPPIFHILSHTIAATSSASAPRTFTCRSVFTTSCSYRFISLRSGPSFFPRETAKSFIRAESVRHFSPFIGRSSPVIPGRDSARTCKKAATPGETGTCDHRHPRADTTVSYHKKDRSHDRSHHGSTRVRRCTVGGVLITPGPGGRGRDTSFKGEKMATPRIAFETIGMSRGLVCIRKRCGFCRQKHLVEFPLDDLHLPRRMTSLCDRCRLQAEQAKQRFPQLRIRRRR
jgi:hypothetical protein